MSDRYPPSRAGGLYRPSAQRQRKEVEVHLVRVPKRRKHRPEPVSKGAWKIAYADFTTAMMAFFLLLWMIVALRPEQKVGLATYFDPHVVTDARTSGAGGMLGGRTLAADGAMVEAFSKVDSPRERLAAPESVTNAFVTRGEADKQIMAWLESRWSQLRQRDLSDAEKKDISRQVEATEFQAAQKELQQALKESPDTLQMQRNLMVDIAPQGLRIQIVDQERMPMFALGSTELNEAGRRMLELVTKVAQKLPHQIAITGHTDGNPYRLKNGFSNWDLSIGRANESRKALIADGLNYKRIASVSGKADTEHLLPDNPLSPVNRRISFVLLKLGEPQS